jgi:PAS domain S-box-containing protein
MDLVYITSGLAFFSLFPLAWALSRLERPVLPWTWLGLSGVFLGASQWLDLLREVLQASPGLAIVSFISSVLASVCLLGFGWLSLRRLPVPRFGVKECLLLALTGLAGIATGLPSIQVAVLHALRWPGAWLFAVSMGRLITHKACRSRPLVAAAAGLWFALLLMGWQAQSLREAVWTKPVAWFLPASEALFPGLALAGGLITVAGLWRHYWSEYGWRPQQEASASIALCRDRMLSALLVLAGLLAWLGANSAERTHIHEEYEELAQQAVFTTSFLDPELPWRLAQRDNFVASPDYQTLKNWCRQVCGNIPNIRLVSLSARQEGRWFYLVDSAPLDAPEYSPPGSRFPEMKPDYLPKEAGAKVFISGPYAGNQGLRVTASVRLAGTKRFKEGGSEIFVHLDSDAAEITRTGAWARLPILVILILVDLLIIGGFVYGRRTRLDALAQALELERSRRQESAIARIAASSTIASGDLKASAGEVTRLAADILRASRAGVWLGSLENGQFQCLALYQTATGTFVDAPALNSRDYPKYFETLALGRTVNASDVWSDPRLVEFRESYFKPQGVKSLLDSPIILEGKLAGVLCVEQTGVVRKWMEDEFRFAAELAEAMARALLSARHKQMEDALLESEKRLTEIINFLPDPTFIIDRDKKVAYWNRAMELITGVPAEQMIGKGDCAYSLPFYGHRRPILIDLVSLSDEEFERGYLEVKREGDSIYAESFIPCLGANGAILWGAARMLKDSEGRFTGAIESVRDVSTRRRMEYALRSAHDELEQRVKERTYELATTNARLRAEISDRLEAEERLRDSNRLLGGMLDGIPDIVGFQLPDHTIIRYNRAGYQALGLTHEAAQGRKCHELMGEAEPCKGCASALACVEKRVVSIDRFVPRFGCYMECRSNPVLDESGQVTVVIEQMRDITERKRNEDALRQAHDELEQRVQERTAELGATNRSLTALLKQQEVNIDLAQQVLALIDSYPPRHTALPGGLNLFITSYYFPCHAAGGDHCFVRNLGGPGHRRTMLSLKDQSGHEVGCVLRSIMTDLIHSSLLQERETPSLEQVMGRLNDEICASDLFAEGDFFTSINVEIEHAPLALRFLSTGHPPFLLLRQTAVLSLPGEHDAGANLPAGMLGNQTLSVGCQPLYPGDKLIFFTDGLLEVPCEQGHTTLTSAQLRDQVEEILRLAPRAGISQICRALLQTLGHLNSSWMQAAQRDDIAMLGVEIELESEILEDVIRPENAETLNQHALRLYKQIAREWKDHGVENPDERLRLVLEETLLNAWRHGNRAQPGRSITLRRRYGNDAQLEVSDEGMGFNAQTIYDPTAFENLVKPSGRGLFIIRMLADEVQWNGKGNVITLYFDRHPLPPGLKKGGEARKNRIELWRPVGGHGET